MSATGLEVDGHNSRNNLGFDVWCLPHSIPALPPSQRRRSRQPRRPPLAAPPARAETEAFRSVYPLKQPPPTLATPATAKRASNSWKLFISWLLIVGPVCVRSDCKTYLWLTVAVVPLGYTCYDDHHDKNFHMKTSWLRFVGTRLESLRHPYSDQSGRALLDD